MELFQGKITNVVRSSSTYGIQTAKTGTTSTDHLTNFEVNGVPIVIGGKSATPVNER